MNQDFMEIAVMLIICVLIIAGVQWFLLRFTHWSVALGATIFISLLISGLYVGYSNATPNGGNRQIPISEYINPMLVVFISLLLGLLVVAYLSKTVMPKAVFLYVVAITAFFVVTRFVYQYIDSATVYQRIFSISTITVENNSEEQLITEIVFKNTSSSLVSCFNPKDSQPPSSNIPRGTDQILFRGYSKTKGMFYHEFPFDYSLCKEKNGGIIGLCFWLRYKVILPIKIVIHPHNKIDLYIDNQLVNQYKLKSDGLSDLIKHKGKYQ
ncbi:hypothetical protein [Flavobacterium adhaerens]|uniref:hypothetical protein n=1 Tax=Flavobacterium adhaerens TaxID=3149043 RepID=UPI0032B5BD94